jgi:hypothetical protein
MGKSTAKSPEALNPHNSLRTENPRAVKPRGAIQDQNDPYIPEFHIPDGSVCVRCGAVYNNQHWNRDNQRAGLLVASGAANEVICPGCTIVEERNPQGILTLSGDYCAAHREELLNILRNEEQRGIQTNPLERIIDIREEKDALIVETTTEKLAQRMGRAIHSAHKGTLDYRWPDGDHLARIYWARD